MDAKRLAVGTVARVASCCTLSATSCHHRIRELLRSGCRSATVNRATELMSLVLGSFAYAAVICYAMGVRPPPGVIGPAKVGAAAGLTRRSDIADLAGQQPRSVSYHCTFLSALPVPLPSRRTAAAAP